MKLNILYGLLTFGASRDYYFKKSTPVQHHGRSKALVDAIMFSTPSSAIPRMACYICWAALQTQFGEDILSLDANNTYAEPARDPLAQSSAYTLTWFIPSASAMNRMRKLLDSDIRDRLSVPSWTELAAAVCLQILREVS